MTYGEFHIFQAKENLFFKSFSHFSLKLFKKNMKHDIFKYAIHSAIYH